MSGRLIVLIKKILFSAAVVLWMMVIFAFSAQPAGVSTDMSHGVGYFIGDCFAAGFDEWSEEEQDAFSDRIDFPVRKCAHASEYAILAVLLLLAVRSYGFTGGRGAVISFAVTAAYAASDEFHQLFVPGRSGMFTDVLVDAAGGLAGCILFFGICRILKINTEGGNNDKTGF